MYVFKCISKMFFFFKVQRFWVLLIQFYLFIGEVSYSTLWKPLYWSFVNMPPVVSRLPFKAVCCADQPAFTDDGGAAAVAPTQPQTDLPWQLPHPSILTTHDPTPHGRTGPTGWRHRKCMQVEKKWSYFCETFTFTLHLMFHFYTLFTLYIRESKTCQP